MVITMMIIWLINLVIFRNFKEIHNAYVHSNIFIKTNAIAAGQVTEMTQSIKMWNHNNGRKSMNHVGLLFTSYTSNAFTANGYLGEFKESDEKRRKYKT